MFDINLVALSGRITRPPRYGETPAGKAVLNIPMAYNVYVGTKNAGNDYGTLPLWFEVTMWGDLAKHWSTKLETGQQLVIQGELGLIEMYTNPESGKVNTTLKITARRAWLPLSGPREEGGADYHGQQDIPVEQSAASPGSKGW